MESPAGCLLVVVLVLLLGMPSDSSRLPRQAQQTHLFSFLDAVVSYFYPPQPTTVTQPAECGLRRNGQKVESRIVGGRPPSRHAWPWAVCLRVVMGSCICGGTLVTTRHVITAAHCIGTPIWWFRLSVSVVVGAHWSRHGGQVHSVAAVTVHPNFGNLAYFDSDLAILHLSDDVLMGEEAAPACLPSAAPLSGTPVVVLGWGTIAYGGYQPDTLMEAWLEVLPRSDCHGYGRHFTGSMLCSGAPPERDACQGDSGGPLLREVDGSWQVVGVVSFGRGCGHPDYPGVYVSVANFTQWLTSVLY